jgi:hypothetical protein
MGDLGDLLGRVVGREHVGLGGASGHGKPPARVLDGSSSPVSGAALEHATTSL